ncbi:hypothetical protein [Mucilaginibacter ginsenosidivorans]|uniref:Uncharacterized protein n=1 Tax=Mucilaginibacter ginsenosidivorans TaxID=398053 RepID=A0A5B8V1A4_9SPHI|nr:hypothetical protein [Mucilaginibacter ginsenosidivorans]QEC64939.1 hypothetical protein FRZ54_20995 [Mucilaginibacter ginsenosidivorans]
MDLAEAKKKLKENKHLIGKVFEGSKISELVILPLNNQHLTDIIMCIDFHQSYDQYLKLYRDFEVVAFLNFDQYPINGYLSSQTLNRVLQGVSEQ